MDGREGASVGRTGLGVWYIGAGACARSSERGYFIMQPNGPPSPRQNQTKPLVSSLRLLLPLEPATQASPRLDLHCPLEWRPFNAPICQPPRLLARWGRIILGALAFDHNCFILSKPFYPKSQPYISRMRAGCPFQVRLDCRPIYPDAAFPMVRLFVMHTSSQTSACPALTSQR